MKKNNFPPETTLFPSRCNHFFALKSSKAKGYQPMMLKTIRFRLKSAGGRKKIYWCPVKVAVAGIPIIINKRMRENSACACINGGVVPMMAFSYKAP